MRASPLHTEVSEKLDAECVQKREADTQRTQAHHSERESSMSISSRDLEVTGKPIASRNSENSGTLESWKQKKWPHNFHMSPASVPHMKKVYSIVRHFYGRSPTDDLNDLDVDMAIRVLFLSVTLQATVHLGGDFMENLRFSKSAPKVCERVIPSDWEVDQGSKRNYRSDHNRLQTAYVEIHDSTMWQSNWDYECQNLRLRRLGAMLGRHQYWTSSSPGKQDTIVFGNSLPSRIQSNRWRTDGIRVEKFPRIHDVRDSKFCDWMAVEHFRGRIIFMSMYNDNAWRERGNTENVLRIALQLRVMLADSLAVVGHSWDLDQKRNGTKPILRNQTEIGTGLLNKWCSTLQKAVIQNVVPPAPWKDLEVQCYGQVAQTSGGSVQGCCSWQSDCDATRESRWFFHRRHAFTAQETNLWTTRSIRAPVLCRQTEITETVGALGQVVPKRPAGVSVSPISRSATSLDEFDPERADEFGPTAADEDKVQQAEELKHVPAPILLLKAEMESHNVSQFPIRSWCSACPWPRTFTWSSLSSHENKGGRTDTDCPCVLCSLGNGKTEHMTHFQCSSCEVARVKASGVTRCRRRVWRTRTLQGLWWLIWMDFMEYKRVILKSDQEPSVVALCDAVKNGWHGEIVTEASPKGESKSNGRGRMCCSICARTCEDPQRLPGTAIWNHVGVSKSAVGLVGRALFQSSLHIHKGEPHDGHTAYMRLMWTEHPLIQNVQMRPVSAHTQNSMITFHHANTPGSRRAHSSGLQDLCLQNNCHPRVMSRSLPHLTLTTSTSSLSDLPHLSFGRSRPHSQFLCCEDSRRSGGSTQVPSPTFEGQALECWAAELWRVRWLP